MFVGKVLGALHTGCKRDIKMRMVVAYGNEKMHLSEADLRPPEAACTICGGDNRSPIVSLQKSPDVWLMQCQDCHVAGVDRIPTQQVLDAYYNKYYEKPKFRHMEEKIHFHFPGRLAQHIWRELEIGSDDVRVLDFGGGDGTIALLTAELLITHGVNKVSITVIDYLEECAQSPSPRIAIDGTSDLQAANPSSYDIVLASASLAHIPYPVTTLRTLLKSLRRGGWFYARTPYFVPLMNLAGLLRIETHFGYPALLYDMGQKFWDSVLRTVGMDDQFTLAKSRPSIVETTLESNALRTIAAYSLKAPWYVLRDRWKLVGGWEVFLYRNK